MKRANLQRIVEWNRDRMAWRAFMEESHMTPLLPNDLIAEVFQSAYQPVS